MISFYKSKYLFEIYYCGLQLNNLNHVNIST